MTLPMRRFLEVVRDHDTSTREVLQEAGFPSKVIVAKADKAARKGYTEYGVVVDRPWLTAEGRAYLDSDRP